MGSRAASFPPSLVFRESGIILLGVKGLGFPFEFGRPSYVVPIPVRLIPAAWESPC